MCAYQGVVPALARYTTVLFRAHVQGIKQLVPRVTATEIHTHRCTLVCTTCIHVEHNDKQQITILVLWLPLYVL